MIKATLLLGVESLMAPCTFKRGFGINCRLTSKAFQPSSGSPKGFSLGVGACGGHITLAKGIDDGLVDSIAGEFIEI